MSDHNIIYIVRGFVPLKRQEIRKEVPATIGDFIKALEIESILKCVNINPIFGKKLWKLIIILFWVVTNQILFKKLKSMIKLPLKIIKALKIISLTLGQN